MPRPRGQLINLEVTPFYHVTSRCVRRAFLCGDDADTGKNYEHRKQWIEERIRLLSSLFAIDVCAYAVMSNHYHVVVKLAPEQADSWSMEDVLQRWRCLFKGTLLVQKYAAGESLSSFEQDTVHETLEVYRDRLTSLSWFMKCLNEPVARMANTEDNCKGHFWESRFASQRLPTDKAILSAMVYVDLNPMRAGVASTPESSEHTSIKERIKPAFNIAEAVRSQIDSGSLRVFSLDIKPLALLAGEPRPPNDSVTSSLPISYTEYLQLVDWSGRIRRMGKHGAIPEKALPILDRLSITASTWLSYTRKFEELYRQGAFREVRSG